MRHIPNIITSLNLVSGFIAILLVMNGDLVSASWMILAAMIFDFLDGFAARILKAYSELGKELDSLADVISFGIAPGLIIYSLLVKSAPGNNITTGNSFSAVLTLFMAVAAFMPVCAALRLAKFNIDTTQSKSFRGLPTPANALAVISIVIAADYGDSLFIKSFTGEPTAIIIFSLALSVLMVTRIPLFSLKFSTLKPAGNYERYLLAIITLLLLILFGMNGVPWIIPAYIIISLLFLLF